jgi:hypothetical protein
MKEKGILGGRAGQIAFRAFLGVLALGFIVTTATYAIELPIGVKPGTKKSLTPRLTVLGSYTDNADTRASNDNNAMGIRVTPEVSLEMPNFWPDRFGAGGKRLYVEGGYRYGRSGANADRNITKNGHLATAGMRYQLSKKASIGSKYSYNRDQYPDVIDGESYNLNSVRTEGKLALTKRLTSTPYYQFESYNGSLTGDSNAAFEDFSDHRVGWETDYKLSEKISVVGRSEYQNRYFDNINSKDFDSYGGTGGLAIQLTKKILLSGEAGYRGRDFDAGGDIGRFVWLSNLQYSPRRKLVMNAFFNRDLEDTFTTGFLKDKGSSTLLDFIPRQFRSLKVLRAGDDVTWAVTDADSLSAGATYQQTKADASESVAVIPLAVDEDDFTIDVNYSHVFADWLRLVLGYNFIKRNSNLSDDFHANTVTFGMRFGW